MPEAYQLWACQSCNKLWVRIKTILDNERANSGNPADGWIGPEQAFTWGECGPCKRAREEFYADQEREAKVAEERCKLEAAEYDGK
jgi:hypothetical protein